MDFLNIASWGLLLAGSFFCIVGGIGLIRLPDFFARIHGAGITDTLGASLVLAGLMVQAGLTAHPPLHRGSVGLVTQTPRLQSHGMALVHLRMLE